MDALFFLSMTFLSAVTAVVFYRCRRRDLVAGEKNEWIIRGTFCHIVAITVFFLLASVLCFMAGADISGDTDGILMTCTLLLVNLIPLLYLRNVRYCSIVSNHIKWIIAAVLFLSFTVSILGFSGAGRLTAVLADCFFVICIMSLFVIALTAQCRLTCRFGKENVSDHLFRNAGVMSLLLLSLAVFIICLMAGKCRKPVSMSGEFGCFVIICLHSVGVIRDYPVLIRLEHKWRKDARQVDMEASSSESLIDAENLTHRLIDYFEVRKPYLAHDLRITEVAMYLMTNKTTLSKAINKGMHCSFRELVNKYRVRDAMDMYMRNMYLDMEQLARRSGFKNNTSFTNAFKINVGKTPGVWCKEYKEMRNEIWQTENLESAESLRKPKKETGEGGETGGTVSGEDRTYQ